MDLQVRIVANCHIPAPATSRIKCIRVEAGPDVADKYIIDAVSAGDIVITADIPLANEVVRAGALAIDIRGQLYSDDNIGQRSAIRDLLHDLREEGMRLGGPKPFGQKDKQRFAATFDRTVTKRIRELENETALSGGDE